jgi:hypothetical protein
MMGIGVRASNPTPQPCSGDCTHMIGVTVVTDDANGYVAHAVLDDGTLSCPMGAGVWTLWNDAAAEALLIRWRDGGPVIDRAN